MRFESVSDELVNKLYRPTKLQIVLDEFTQSNDLAVRLVIHPGEYANLRSAQSSYMRAIRRLHYPIAVRTLNGGLYLIKVLPESKGGF